MRQLHFVEHNTATGRVVLATSDGLERFELAIDQALREIAQPAASPATPPSKATSTAPSSALSTSTSNSPSASNPPWTDARARLTPREIQMRVRAGESAQALADERSAGLDWVMRFAGPVLAERRRMSDEARRAKARRSTTAGQSVVFGEAVDERFAAHGLDPVAVRWDAHRREDAQWIVTAHWVGGHTERSAEWAFNLAGRTVAPVDDTAADLLSDRPIRPILAPPNPDVPPSLSLAPPLEPGLTSVAGISDGRLDTPERTEEVFDQEQFDERVDDRGQFDDRQQFDDSAQFDADAVTTPAHVHFDAPPLPMPVPDSPPTARIPKITNAGGVGRKAADAHRTARPTVPSWDDILLGVRRKQD